MQKNLTNIDNYNQTTNEMNNYETSALSSVSIIPDDYGLIPRVFCDIIEGIQRKDITCNDTKITISFIEIYNEKIKDLLIQNNQNNSNNIINETLKVREHPHWGPYVENLTKIEINPINSINNILEIIYKGYTQRNSNKTSMNVHSSRSHAIVTLELTSKTMIDPTLSTSMKFSSPIILNNNIKSPMKGSLLEETNNNNNQIQSFVRIQMIDLAGSEKIQIKKNDPNGQTNSLTSNTMKINLDSKYNKIDNITINNEKMESRLIRRSLSTLGYIIRNLSRNFIDNNHSNSNTNTNTNTNTMNHSNSMNSMNMNTLTNTLTNIQTNIQQSNSNTPMNTQTNINLPYRDSVLTWLLKDSLIGKNYMTMISTISPSYVNYEETLLTLKYSERLCNINNNHFNSNTQTDKQNNKNNEIWEPKTYKNVNINETNNNEIIITDEILFDNNNNNNINSPINNNNRTHNEHTPNSIKNELNKIYETLGTNEYGSKNSRFHLKELISDPQQRIAKLEALSSNNNQSKQIQTQNNIENSNYNENIIQNSDIIINGKIINTFLLLKNEYRLLNGKYIELQIELKSIKTDFDSLLLELKTNKEEILNYQLNSNSLSNNNYLIENINGNSNFNGNFNGNLNVNRSLNNTFSSINEETNKLIDYKNIIIRKDEIIIKLNNNINELTNNINNIKLNNINELNNYLKLIDTLKTENNELLINNNYNNNQLLLLIEDKNMLSNLLNKKTTKIDELMNQLNEQTHANETNNHKLIDNSNNNNNNEIFQLINENNILKNEIKELKLIQLNHLNPFHSLTHEPHTQTSGQTHLETQTQTNIHTQLQSPTNEQTNIINDNNEFNSNETIINNNNSNEELNKLQEILNKLLLNESNNLQTEILNVNNLIEIINEIKLKTNNYEIILNENELLKQQNNQLLLTNNNNNSNNNLNNNNNLNEINQINTLKSLLIESESRMNYWKNLAENQQTNSHLQLQQHSQLQLEAQTQNNQLINNKNTENNENNNEILIINLKNDNNNLLNNINILNNKLKLNENELLLLKTKMSEEFDSFWLTVQEMSKLDATKNNELNVLINEKNQSMKDISNLKLKLKLMMHDYEELKYELRVSFHFIDLN